MAKQIIPGKQNTSRLVPRGIMQAGINQVVLPDGTLLPVNPYQCQTIFLDSVFPDTEYDFVGTNFMAVFSSSSTAVCMVKFNLQTNDPIPFYAPLSFNAFPFQKFWVSNTTAQAGATITLLAILDQQKTRETETL